MTDTATTADPAAEHWRTYDEFAAGIDTFRLPSASLDGTMMRLHGEDGTVLEMSFAAEEVTWSARGPLLTESGAVDPYDAVAVREGVLFLNLPLESRERTALTIVASAQTNRAVIVLSRIQPEAPDAAPQVTQRFVAAVTDGGPAQGESPTQSRDLIGKRNLYRYSPEHLYEHVYLSSQRYSWQCLEGVQRGHGDTDLSTVWKLDEGLYVFCFREFRIAVASVWLHDLGYQLRTTGIFLGLNGSGDAEHSRAGGHIYPLGAVAYPDAQPI